MSELFIRLLSNMSPFVITISAFTMVKVEYACASEIETLHLSTNIDIAKLFPGPIIGAVFSPNPLTLNIKSDGSGFENASSTLQLSTNIPSKVLTDISYTITLTENRTQCFDMSNTGPVEQVDFVETFLEDQSLQIGQSIHIPDFTNSSDTNKSSSHLLSFHFKGFDEVVTRHQPDYCSGKISLDIGVDI
ncbi:hypothetical protein [Vibrio coralliirubri]|uniref:hypothetical protein n=1 Tax=Vibrio coralliirubri TaxID=1516159 RepID=UPI000634B553|nr:hypothetical protein [Vibrio coralliirubri]CDT20121.1 conserved hypothetical protein [Vibrio coralliirubri]CDT78975.1 conserved hypothetical protein [Vibrio coralliirubri]CDT81919.1 conserved hypothetical protein [Vibrio coralliirubri]CDU13266.1 conserved hypothetical protein [Vibrio coralliirubri]